MTAWVRGNKIEISLVLAVVFLVSVIGITLTYAEKEGAQNSQIEKNAAASSENAQEIGELTDMLREHVETSIEAAETTVKMKTDIDYIKRDINEIKFMLRGAVYDEKNH